MIKNKCDYLYGAVAVPTDIIDKYLKLAPAASFKVLLFILRNPDGAANAEQIAMCTGLAPVDVEDCLAFWESNGVIAIDDKYDEEIFELVLDGSVAMHLCSVFCCCK